MTKNKYTTEKAALALFMGTGIFFSLAWPFFRLCTYAGKKKSKAAKTYRKKWFHLKHTTVNHPKYRYEEKYNHVRAWCEKQPMQDWYIRSAEGYRLHASYFPAEDPKRFVILCHGNRGTRFGSIAVMAKELHEAGCSLLFIDQRGCGESEGKYITFGAREQYDLLEWVGRLSEENTLHLPVYLYGQSMGATTVMLAAGHRLSAEVKGLICDCGFHSMKQQLRDIASGWFKLHFIELMLLRVDLFCRVFAGFSMKETDTTVALEKNKRPILFFHGADDTYVKPKSTKWNFALCGADKEMVIVQDAMHLCSAYREPQLYKKKILEFFDKYDEPSA